MSGLDYTDISSTGARGVSVTSGQHSIPALSSGDNNMGFCIF